MDGFVSWNTLIEVLLSAYRSWIGRDSRKYQVSGTVEEMMGVWWHSKKRQGRVDGAKLAAESAQRQDQQLRSDNLPMLPSKSSTRATNHPRKVCGRACILTCLYFNLSEVFSQEQM